MKESFSRGDVLKVRDRIAEYKSNVSKRYDEECSMLSPNSPGDSPESRYLHSLLLVIGGYEIALQEIDNLLG